MKELVAPIERAAHAIALRLAPLGLTQAEAHVLARLSGGPASVNDLHRVFGHKRSTLTAVLDRLEARGYARRAVNPGDRRSVVVNLTPQGKPVARKVRRAVSTLEREVASACSERDLAGFATVLGYVTSIASPKE